MPAYLIADVEVTDPLRFGKYIKGSAAVLAAYGGSYVARGASANVLEGDWAPTPLTILKFDDLAQANAWYESDDYRPLREIRQKSTKSNILIVEGM